MLNLVASQAQSFPVSIIDLLVSMCLALSIGLWMVFTYRFTHRGLTYERSFLTTLLLMPAIVGLIMMLIGSNLALSLGMVGALSIIRFRTVIKDSRDMIYLFWGIAVGLGSGTLNWVPAIISSVFIGVVLLMLFFLKYGQPRQDNFVLVVKSNSTDSHATLLKTLEGMGVIHTTRSLETRQTQQDCFVEMVFEIRFAGGPESEDPMGLLNKVRNIGAVTEASLLAPHLSLPL
ncbi:MAG: DUF4956 domain-containing protein [Magnetococcales bacterium]|nr:DUF4956 domain-containing protein [Magnetococcales bacterium]